jgi:cell division protein FtsB
MKPQRPSTGRVKPTRMPSASAGREQLMRGLRFDARTITLAVIVVLGIVSLAPQVQVLITQQQAIADMRAQVEKAQQAVKDMKVERQRWDDPVYIRAQARDRLYYVMPGEVSYLVMDANGINQSDTSGTVGAMIAARNNNAQISSTVHTTNNNWVDSVVETIVRSGLDQPIAAGKAGK